MSDLILSNAVLTNARGIPQAPSDIVASLKRIDERLGLLHLRPSEVEYEGNPQAQGSWAIIIEWAQNDPRRARIRSGEIDPTAGFDYLTTLPFDCPPDQARAYFERAVKGAAHMPEARTLLNRVSEWNAKQAELNAAPIAELAAQIADASKGNPDFAEAVGGGTVVTSAGGIDKPPVITTPPAEVKRANFVERMLAAKRAKAAARGVTT
jgi:hypothetical protein